MRGKETRDSTHQPPNAQVPAKRGSYLRTGTLLSFLLGGLVTSVQAAAEAAPAPLPFADRLSAGAYLMLHAGTAGVAPGAHTPAAPRQLAPAAVTQTSPAALDPKVGAGTRLGDEDLMLPTGYRAQAEPHIARSYIDADLLVATVQDGRFTDGGAVACGYAISQDGGRTWNRGLIPHLISSIDGGPFSRASDPVAGVDLHGNIYLSTLALKGQPPAWVGTVVVSKSTDRGATFGTPVIIYQPTNTAIFPDKNWMAINTFPGTPAAGRIVVTFARVDNTDPNFSSEPIALTWSDDGARTWSPAVIISPPQCQGAQPVFLPDGSLAVIYWNFGEAGLEQIQMVFSADGGRTFAKEQTVTSVTRYADPTARAAGFLPSVASDRFAGVLYVTYQTRAVRGGASVPSIMFTRSRDKGQTWTKPMAVNDTPAGRSVFNPAIAVSPEGQHLTIVFYDKRHDPGQGLLADFYLAESFDGGDTWQPNLRLSATSSDLSLAPRTDAGYMVGDYEGIVPALNFDDPAMTVWVDTRTGSPDLFVTSVKRTRGTTFGAWRELWFSPAELADQSLSADTADPDGDGLPNLLEYALGSNPKQASSDPVRRTLNSAPGGNSLALTVEPLGVLGDLDFAWRGSTDLVTWTEVAPVSQRQLRRVEPLTQPLESTFALSSPRRFFRLGVARRPPAWQFPSLTFWHTGPASVRDK